jgi:hypothetical protein
LSYKYQSFTIQPVVSIESVVKPYDARHTLIKESGSLTPDLAGSMLVSSSGKPFAEEAGIPAEAQIRQDVAYINSMLTKLGMECPLSILQLPDEQNSNGKAEENWSASRRWELGQACSVMIPLLTAKVREQAFRNEVEDRVRRLAEDLQDRSTQLVLWNWLILYG